MELLSTATGPVLGATLGEELARVALLHALGPGTPLDHSAEFARDVEWVRERDLKSPSVALTDVLKEGAMELQITALDPQDGELRNGPPYAARIAVETKAEPDREGAAPKPVSGYGHTPAEALRTLALAMQGREIHVGAKSVKVPMHVTAAQLIEEVDACERQNAQLLAVARARAGSITMRRKPTGAWDSRLSARTPSGAHQTDHSSESYFGAVNSLVEASLGLAPVAQGLRPLPPAPRAPERAQTAAPAL